MNPPRAPGEGGDGRNGRNGRGEAAFDIVQSATAPAGAPPAHEPGGMWFCARSPGGEPLGAVHTLPEQGRSRSRCSFHLGRVVHSAPELGLHQVQATLQLGHDATGEAELSGLWLAPALSGSDAVQVADALLKAACDALADAPTPAQWVVVELPGWRDAAGRSPFFDGLVRHFLPAGSLEPDTAAHLHGPHFGSHLGEMLPRQLIHAAFLPAQAQQALGRCAAIHGVWQQALQRAGFADWQHVRIEDGGPLLAKPRRRPDPR